MIFWCQSCGEQHTSPHAASANITVCAQCGGSHFATWQPNQSLSLESVRSEALQKRENEVWNEVVESCLRAWPGENVFYDQSPIELITRLINERDEALQSPARVAEGGNDAVWNEEIEAMHAMADELDEDGMTDTAIWLRDTARRLTTYRKASPAPESPVQEQPGEPPSPPERP